MNRILLLTLLIPGLSFAGANEDFAAGVAAYKKKDYAEAEKSPHGFGAIAVTHQNDTDGIREGQVFQHIFQAWSAAVSYTHHTLPTKRIV